MTAYCFFDVLEFTDPAKIEKYRAGAAATVAQYGGRYLIAGGKCDVVEGTWRPTYPVMLEFPSLEQAHRWYNSPEYRPLLELRKQGARAHAVFIEGRS
jgi:uncharacterized protein (DUF1330 family)